VDEMTDSVASSVHRGKAALIFTHVPKTGGISFRNMLKLKVLLSPITNVLHHNLVLGQYKHGAGRLEALKELGEVDRKRIRYFEGHYGFGVHEYIPIPCHYVTLLRHPVERTISTYFHLQKPAVRERLGVPRTTDLKELMMLGQSWGGAHYFDNCHIRYFAGQAGYKVDVPFGACTRGMLDLAKRRLENEYTFIGLTEYFDESVVLLGQKLDWGLGFYVKMNVTHERKSAEALDDRTLAFIVEANELDIELYQFACDLFFQEIDVSGKEFGTVLERFRRNNRLLSAAVARFRGVANTK
jgi:hypothetical protein